VDSSGPYFVSIHVRRCDPPPKGEAERLFAPLILNEQAMGGALSLDNLGLATLILGEDEAGQRLSPLAASTPDGQDEEVALQLSEGNKVRLPR
jgi:hypothetical protein